MALSLPIGVIASTGKLAERNPARVKGKPLNLTLDALCTSALVVGPPGSGKTTGIAYPLLSYLLGDACRDVVSVVVLDPKGDDFISAGEYDYMIDLFSSSSGGFSLFGGTEARDVAAVAAACDRLANALLPERSAVTAFYSASARNALYAAVAPFVAVKERWPTVRELLALLTEPKGGIWQSVRDLLTHRALMNDYAPLIERRQRQLTRREDPAASLVESLSELDRPHLRRVLDDARPQFSMHEITDPVRVHIALPHAQSPETVRILARLAMSQFVQVCAAPTTSPDIYKFLFCDEASVFIDDYVVAGARLIRSQRGGMMLLTQSFADIPPVLRASLFGSIGCKFAFPGLGPDDARTLSDYWGTKRDLDTSTSVSYEDSEGTMRQSQSTRNIERPIWSVAELINEVPHRHCVISLADYHGSRTPPVLVSLEGALS